MPLLHGQKIFTYITLDKIHYSLSILHEFLENIFHVPGVLYNPYLLSFCAMHPFGLIFILFLIYFNVSYWANKWLLYFFSLSDSSDKVENTFSSPSSIFSFTLFFSKISALGFITSSFLFSLLFILFKFFVMFHYLYLIYY